MLAARATILAGLVATDELMNWLYLTSLRSRVFLFGARGGNAVSPRLLCRIERRVSGCYNFVTCNALRGILRNSTADRYGPRHAGKMVSFNLAPELFRHAHGILTSSFRHHNGKLFPTI